MSEFWKISKEPKDKNEENDNTGRGSEHELSTIDKLKKYRILQNGAKSSRFSPDAEIVKNLPGRWHFDETVRRYSNSFDYIYIDNDHEIFGHIKFGGNGKGEGGGAQNHQLDEILALCVLAKKYIENHDDNKCFEFIPEGPGFLEKKRKFEVGGKYYKRITILQFLKEQFECDRIKIGEFDEIKSVKWEGKFEKRKPQAFWPA